MAVDTEARAVGRNGLVTLDEASAALRKLREATRGELADELGVKPIAVGRFLTQLTERKLAAPDTDERGLYYRALMEPLEGEVFQRPDPKPEPEPELNDGVSVVDPDEGQKAEEDAEEAKRFGRVTPEEVRDWAIMLERFTIYQLAGEMEVSYGTARRYVDRLVDQGILVDSGWKGQHDAVIYELRGEVEDAAQRFRPRRTPVEREVLEKFGSIEMAKRGITQALGELPKVSNNKDVRILVAEAKAFGWEVETRANHAVVIPPGAPRPIPVPSTPKGPGMVRAFRDQLRAAGLPDLGDPNAQEGPTDGRGKTVEATSRGHKHRRATQNVAGTRRPGRTNKKRHDKR